MKFSAVMAGAICAMSAVFAAPVNPKPDEGNIFEPYSIGTGSIPSSNSAPTSHDSENEANTPESYSIGGRSVRFSDPRTSKRDGDGDIDILEPYTIGTRSHRSNGA
ncbi:hypothetical protein EV356DRAFT_517461 [Viridothelium virens]|uniref:Uncharacterized protein n=1 Tax=Viridothelium virens TaxID=1048519 RepID=A0A6A6H379_VIRVR|nr:hypothetical protein EV356DRAFT_517461 [Viridothelium virens]